MIKTIDELGAVSKYLKRIGATARNFKTAVVKEMHGKYWRDVALITFNRDGSIRAPEQYAPTDIEAKAIQSEIQQQSFPEMAAILEIVNPPKLINDAAEKDTFVFRDLHGYISMVQIRIEHEEGKNYIPCTYWSDGIWRFMEPEGLLPLWGIEQIKEHGTVFIHEGAKTARAMYELANPKTPKQHKQLLKHPWGRELSNAAHLGWIGGALNVHRTNWSMLNREGISTAYVVSDNDKAGIEAVPKIAYNLRMPTWHVQFTNEWPTGFDLADPWPESMFRKREGITHYLGPIFRSCVHPATWATDQIPQEKRKPLTVLRDSFKGQWIYSEESDLFICRQMPEIVRDEKVANNVLMPFSHVKDTTRLILKEYQGRSVKMCYRPDRSEGLIIDGDNSAINLHTPSQIRAQEGDPEIWLEFMAYLIPDDDECNELLRWCATLIAHPEIRMEYGVLLVSQTQGVGKTTLGMHILAPLVGMHNASFPGEQTISQSDFNGWCANKRLAVVNEIYSGHSWKAYHRAKSILTDRHIEVNQKYQRPYTTDNWCHIFASSNSLRALRIEQDDRRWYYPTVTENLWPQAKYAHLYNWLSTGGLSIIKHWAHDQKDIVMPGFRAPMTQRKYSVIQESMSEAQQEVQALAEAMNNLDEPVAISMKDIITWARSSSQGKVYDSPTELKTAMRHCGVTITERLQVQKRMQVVILNNHKYWKRRFTKAEITAKVKEHLKDPTEVIPPTM